MKDSKNINPACTITKVDHERRKDMIPFTSKMDKELKKEAQIYCLTNDIDLIDLLDYSVSQQITHNKNTTKDS